MCPVAFSIVLPILMARPVMRNAIQVTFLAASIQVPLNIFGLSA
jgi:ABC-type sulfate transport system permease subunit